MNGLWLLLTYEVVETETEWHTETNVFIILFYKKKFTSLWPKIISMPSVEQHKQFCKTLL